MTLLSWLLIGVAGLFILNAIGSIFSLQFGAAVTQLVLGLAVPLAVWLIARLLADTVALQNQSLQKQAEMTAYLASMRMGTQAGASAEPYVRKTETTTTF
jgi:hypothetical protein